MSEITPVAYTESQFDYIRRHYADVVNDELSKPLFGANYPSESEQSERGLAISPWDGH